MIRKRKTKQNDPNQLMLFSVEEMAGAEVACADDKKESKGIEESGGLGTLGTLGNSENSEDSEDSENSENSEDSESPKDTEEEESAAHAPQPLPESLDNSKGVELMKKVMRLLDGLHSSQVRLVAMQSAALVQSGVDSLENYRLPALPGMVLRGDAVEYIAYVSIVRSFPNMIDRLGLDLSSEYESAGG